MRAAPFVILAEVVALLTVMFAVEAVLFVPPFVLDTELIVLDQLPAWAPVTGTPIAQLPPELIVALEREMFPGAVTVRVPPH